MSSKNYSKRQISTETIWNSAMVCTCILGGVAMDADSAKNVHLRST